MSRLRSRRVRALREPLSDPEVAELLAGGPPPGEPSAFANAADLLAARTRLAIERLDWDELDEWRHKGAANELRMRRHMVHVDEVPPADPRFPALVDVNRCPICTHR